MVRCSCCSSKAVSRLEVAGRQVQALGLPALLARYRNAGGCPDQLYKTLRVYNSIPGELDAEYRQAVMRALAAYRSAVDGDSPVT